MDNAVALVQAYLQINGYFTVTEYPVLEGTRQGYRAATDLDVLAFRFPGAGRLIPSKGRPGERRLTEVDRALNCPADRADMLIGEVKEGHAELNRATRDTDVLRTVFTRFGCCPPEHVPALVKRLLHEGATTTPAGHTVRLVAFGSEVGGPPSPPCTVVSLGHVVGYLRDYLREHWEILRHGQFKHPALGFLMTLEKASRGRRQDPATGNRGQ